MTLNLLVNTGEEAYTELALDGISIDVGLYLDATDSFSDTSNIGDETTEPTNTNYARQTSTVTTKQISGDFGFDNDSLLSFDFSDQSTSQDVDGALIVHNFQSDTVAGDAGASDNLIGNPALGQTRDIGSIDTLEVAAGDLEVTVD